MKMKEQDASLKSGFVLLEMHFSSNWAIFGIVMIEVYMINESVVQDMRMRKMKSCG
jgi:hypothetical protein